MLFELQSLLLATTIMQSLRACIASPVERRGGRLHSKREPIICRPILRKSRFRYRDCIGALNMMGQDAHNLNQILSFGIGSGVDVSIDIRDPMAWEYGTMQSCLERIDCVRTESHNQLMRLRRNMCGRAPGARRRSTIIHLAKPAERCVRDSSFMLTGPSS